MTPPFVSLQLQDLPARSTWAGPNGGTRRTKDPCCAASSPFGWEAWVGISGILYARWARSTPPIVVRAATAEDLAAKVAEAQQGRQQ